MSAVQHMNLGLGFSPPLEEWCRQEAWPKVVQRMPVVTQLLDFSGGTYLQETDQSTVGAQKF